MSDCNVRWFAAAVLIAVATGCGSSGTGPGGKTACSPPLSIGPTEFTEGNGTVVDVQYQATQTGDGTLTSLTYAGPSGNVTVQNPSLPYNFTTTVTLPTQVTMSASGFYTNGTITIAYSANVSGGNSGDIESANQVCGGNTG